MTLGKNKKLGKKKGIKKTIDPISRKEWFQLTTPAPFQGGSFGFTCINKSAATVVATEAIKGRVVETSLADIWDNSDQMAWRKVKLIIDDVEGNRCRTSFYGLDITKDKLASMVRKHQTLIDTHVEAKSSDGYILRVFVVAFTARNDRSEREKQVRKTSYAKQSQILAIRKIIREVISKEVAKRSIVQLSSDFNQETFEKPIKELTAHIYPLQNITIRKVKLIKRPKVDATTLRQLYEEGSRVSNNKAGGQVLRRKGMKEEAEAANLVYGNPVEQQQQPQE